jgi:hypothetical protein
MTQIETFAYATTRAVTAQAIVTTTDTTRAVLTISRVLEPGGASHHGARYARTMAAEAARDTMRGAQRDHVRQ